MKLKKWFGSGKSLELSADDILKAAPDSIIVVDEKGLIIKINEQTNLMFRYSGEELLGQAIEVMVPSASQKNHVHLRETYFKSPKVRTMDPKRDLNGLRKDGSTFPVDISLSPVKVGGQLAVIAVIRDITERKAMESMKNEFVSTVSHEIRTPITSVYGALELLNKENVDGLPEQSKQLLKIASANSEKLYCLVNDVLDVQKIEAGKLALKKKAESVVYLLDKTIENNGPFAKKYKVNMKVVTGSEDVKIKVDLNRITQVLDNLLSNAIKFSPAESTVELGFESKEKEVLIFVRDYGKGISSDFQQKLFSKFAQQDSSSTRHQGGTGLGLSIVKQLVELHGGTVDLQTSEKGSTFFVHLPKD